MINIEKKQNLIKYCQMQIDALRKGGFDAGEVAGVVPFPKYHIDYETPDLTVFRYDFVAIKYLIDNGLLNSGTCPKCGSSPITNEYQTSSGFDRRIQISICFECKSEYDKRYS